MSEHADVPEAVLRELRTITLALPEAAEEEAWAGTRWVVRRKNFAHVVQVDGGWPPAYARAAGTDGPCTVLTFRSAPPELDVLRNAGPPFFAPVWFADIVGMVLGTDVDWVEVAELVTESYCALAPKALAARVRAAGPPDL